MNNAIINFMYVLITLTFVMTAIHLFGGAL